MLVRLLSIGILSAATAVMALAPAKLTPYTEKDKPHSYDLQVKVDMQGQEVLYTAHLRETVTAKKADGSFSQKNEIVESYINMGGYDESQGTELATSHHGKNGLPTKVENEEPTVFHMRFMRLWAMSYPEGDVEVGSRWEVRYDHDADLGTPATKLSYEIVGKESVDGYECYKIKYEAHESESTQTAGGNGFHWIDIKSGLRVKSQGEMTNAPVQDQVFDMKYTSTLRKSKS
ncbi:MAG: hypothetical protein KDC26_03905 [Armatimonadetes bacterium]|nr:hypothetical protein [Armatimonadota bacterium]